MDVVTIHAARVNKDYPLAFKKYPADAGHDLYATRTMILWPFVPARIPLNIMASIPEGTFGRICGRSSLNALGIHVLPGTVDSGYIGQVFAVAVNLTLVPRRIRAGDRVAQMIFIPCCRAHIAEVDALTPTERGGGGFGSTGK